VRNGAIHQGALASDCIADALDGGTTALGEYSSRLDQLRRVYSQRHRDVYLSERRWKSIVLVIMHPAALSDCLTEGIEFEPPNAIREVSRRRILK